MNGTEWLAFKKMLVGVGAKVRETPIRDNTYCEGKQIAGLNVVVETFRVKGIDLKDEKVASAFAIKMAEDRKAAAVKEAQKKAEAAKAAKQEQKKVDEAAESRKRLAASEARNAEILKIAGEFNVRTDDKKGMEKVTAEYEKRHKK